LKAFIFLLEDNDLERELFLQQLSSALSKNDEVISASSGETAIELIKNTKVKPSIFILDLNMPGQIKGKDVLKYLCENQEYSNSAKIILSSSDDPRDINECNEIGCTEFLSKPETKLKTKALIKRVLEQYRNG
jgi:CheY-like chemotaxis protein